VREQVVQDRLGRRQEAGRGHQAGQEGPGLRQEYRIPRVDRPGRREGAPRGASLSYEGYIITAPRSLAEETALQNLLGRGMLQERQPRKVRGPTGGEASPQGGRRQRGRDTETKKGKRLIKNFRG